MSMFSLNVASRNPQMDMSELQAVILAGPGKSLSPLTQGTPKALLPIAGKPMISYSLQWIESAGIKDVLIVAAQSHGDQLTTYVRSLEGRRPELVLVDDHLGSGAALRKVLDKLRQTNVVVMSVDTIPADSPMVLLDQFRTHNAAMLALYYGAAPDAAADQVIGLAPLNPVRDRTSVAPATGVARLVAASLRAKVTEASGPGMPLRLDMLREFPTVRMVRAQDAHLYIFRTETLRSMLGDKAGSIQRETVPALIKSQYVTNAAKSLSPGTVSPDDMDVDHDHDHDREADAANQASMAIAGLTPSNGTLQSRPVILAYLSQAGADASPSTVGASSMDLATTTAAASGAPLHAQLAAIGHPGARANTPAGYAELNRTLAKLAGEHRVAATADLAPRTQVGPESMVGDQTRVGERSSVKKSVVGARCVIGRNVKLVNCVLMDGVAIDDEVKLESCIVCPLAQVGEKCTLKDSIVAAKVVVPRETTAKNELFS
ncbi:hypothetical protein AMAG_05543 [Allomyces macrogynus ATCC 38327]|uniref:Translation initiation factor eIF2B subunit gamma n=1 Tax=Allomyces macrogynus (strain ATCC 38327) TaxID=578462 RepID=A0A0L0SCH0_ALLM3|nr:hypothetical protein AMAG_05543 [Allomyces macrogynus ATCC 38327]|eukprot:KNE60119.1 hypothetical protein AMAG_05543 [Allomyces macrogynus ATCC 38327]